MEYADFVREHFGEEYIFEIGDKVVMTKDVGWFLKGDTVEIVGVSGRGYDLMNEHGDKIIETGWKSIRKEAK